MAALSFVVGVLAAACSDLGFRLDQHPLGLLAAVPSPLGLIYGVLLFGLPGLCGVWIARQTWPLLSSSRMGRLVIMLVLISAMGFLAMAIFPLHLEDASGTGAGLHAGAWLMWLSAWLSALALATWVWGRQKVWVRAALSLLLCVATALLASGLDGVLSGPAAQLLCYVGWLVGLAGLAAIVDRG